ncbi:phospholipase A1-like [Danaus plexippus]|uniref:phospholipase A1-like n=1 Tax=Danaus plexippus TaxID=13037 RepID=UPI002AAF6EE2|nr:phospholipase A1-like [Danaus plexippus]
MSAGAVGFFLFLFIAICSGNNKEAKLRYYLDSFENFEEWPIYEATKILSTAWYNSTRTTVIFCHGFTGIPTGPAVTAVIKTYLEQGESNVALLNWDYLASKPMPSLASSYVNFAVPNARQLGVRLASTFLDLSEAGMDLNKTHLIGHSLGAHILGIAGNHLAAKGVQLPWITGLDPAAVGFENKAARLYEGSALFVDVIHTDPNKYGTSMPSGTVDFWPNFKSGWPIIQPGCGRKPAPALSKEDLCNHNRSWELLVNAIKYPDTLIGCHAKNYRIWKNYSKDERNAYTLAIGIHNITARAGNYYFMTNSEPPYGMAEDGL